MSVSIVLRARVLNNLQVASLPLQLYEYKYDTVVGRRQLGVIGSELQVCNHTLALS